MEQANNPSPFGISFVDEMKTMMEDFNNNPEPDKAKMAISQLSELKNVVADNLSKEIKAKSM